MNLQIKGSRSSNVIKRDSTGSPGASLGAQLVKNLPAMWRPGFDPWVGKIPWRLPTPVFWPGEFHGLYNPWGCKKLDMTERLSLTLHSHSSWIDFLNLWMSQSKESPSSFQTITEEPGKSVMPITAVTLDEKCCHWSCTHILFIAFIAVLSFF